MNCPKCGEDGLAHTFSGENDAWLECLDCGWTSPTLEALVLASPAYRKAKLRAEGAKPGWYGPDSKKLELGPIGDPKYARLCGFVEVTHE
jgi:hypothetical protein